MKYYLKLLFFVFVFNTSNSFSQNDKKSDSPNIVFIASDDLNDWIGVLNGHPQVKTPNIDRLANRGTLFTNAHAQAPLCNPSRVSILTGLRPTTTGIYGLAPRHREVERTKEVVTLPQYFEKRGYRTLSTGKIFHGGITPTERAIEFQDWGPDGGHRPFPPSKIVKAPLDMIDHPLIDWGIYPVEHDSIMDDYKVASWAVEQINEIGKGGDSNPFFLAVGFNKPHVPLYTSQKWFDLYPKDEIILPLAPFGDRNDIPDFAWNLHWYLPEPRLSWLIANQEWENKVRAYLATISFMDAQVGRVLDALEENNLTENTIIVFWSDHGYHLGEKDITGKNSLWERSTHVPLIFAGPGVSKGAISSQPVELLDIYPTLVEMALLSKNDAVEGISLKPQLEDANAKRTKPAITTHNPGNNAVRTERWRYIKYADGSEELYDHYRDDEEWSNLAYLDEYRELKAELSKWLPKTSAPLAEGSKHRILYEKDGVWYWEGEPILFDELIK
ncbi:sulfatase [Algoriphagus machipongonensis]|uniref:Sulfatase family protein n=1 Tax=Algoriphagus machipongonensis TaxID=388413 RepID=A3HTC6_9BACT|nr:sulfatase [Algoriphagus machipongonensis]EAZ83094.1 sulfatase family protein [Algoriphagus machipongonensis]